MAKPLDAIKSTSFFDRVDNIESAPPPSKPKSAKPAKGSKREETGKQQTLASFKAAPTNTGGSRALGPSESIAMTETDPDESLMEDEEEIQEAQRPSLDPDADADAVVNEEEGKEEREKDVVTDREGSPDWDDDQADVEM